MHPLATATEPVPTGLDSRSSRVLAAVSLCPDGIGREAVECITGLDVAEPIGYLAAVGLVEASRDVSGTHGAPVARRYRPTLPADPADQQGTVERRLLSPAHCDYYLRLAELHVGKVWTRSQPTALPSLGQERRNIASALRWAVANGQGGRAVALVAALAPYWRRVSELATLRSLVMDLIGLESSLSTADAHRVNVLAADVFARLGEREAALDAIAAAARVATATSLDEAAKADQMFAAGLALHPTAGARAVDQMSRAVANYRAIGDEAAAVGAEFELSGSMFVHGRPRDADRTARTALSSAIRRGDEFTSAALLLRLGAFAAANDASAAVAYVERALVKLRALGAATAVGVLAGQVDTHLEPSVVQRGTALARLLGSISAHHRADFRDPPPDIAVARVERRLLDQFGERALTEAVTSGARLPLPELFAEISARMLRPTAADAADASRPAGLTRRETEVALLVCEGLTNREVARRLEISEWTVVNHMRQIMRKLDCNSRVQVARVIATL